jgi:hypothetical protein
MECDHPMYLRRSADVYTCMSCHQELVLDDE